MTKENFTLALKLKYLWLITSLFLTYNESSIANQPKVYDSYAIIQVKKKSFSFYRGYLNPFYNDCRNEIRDPSLSWDLIEILQNRFNQDKQLKISGKILEELYLTLWASEASVVDNKKIKSAIKLPFVGETLSDKNNEFKLSISVASNIKTIYVPLEFRNPTNNLKFRYLLKINFNTEQSSAEALPVLDTQGRYFCNSRFFSLGNVIAVSDQAQSTTPLPASIKMGTTSLVNPSLQGFFSMSPEQFINISAHLVNYQSQVATNLAINKQLLNLSSQLLATRKPWISESKWGRTQWGWLNEVQYQEVALVTPIGFNQFSELQQASLAWGVGGFSKFFSSKYGLLAQGSFTLFPLFHTLDFNFLNGHGYDFELSLQKAFNQKQGVQFFFKRNQWQRNYFEDQQSGQISNLENTLIGLRYLYLF